MFRSIKKVFYAAFLAVVFLWGFTLGNDRVSPEEIANSLKQAVSEAVDLETAKSYMQQLTTWIDAQKILETMGQLAEKILE